MYRAVARAVGTADATWINVPLFCEEAKQSYTPGAYNPWLEYQEVRRLVVLDDLFGKALTPHEVDQILTRLLDTAYQNNAALFVSMNPPAEKLDTFLRPHEISRLLAGCTIIPVTSTKDWRA